MPTFKQKTVIKTYKLRLQEKLKAVSEETENATSFLNNCLSEFKSRVQEILEIKDEKCLTLYRKLIRDLENYSEKLFILQASLEEVTEEESESSENEESVSHNSKKHTESSKEVLFQNACVENKSKTIVDESQSSASVSYSRNEIHLSSNKEKDDPHITSSEDGEASVTEDDFCSLQSDIHVQNMHNIKESHSQAGRNFLEPYLDQCQSSQSFSQSSCYRSLSSNIYDSLPVSLCEENKNNQYVQSSADVQKEQFSKTHKANIEIQSPVIDVPSCISATLTFIEDPGNFWIQLENSYGSHLRFPKTDYAHVSCLTFILEGSYCLAPFKTSPFFYRAKSLSTAKCGTELVTIHFIDHGSTQDIPLCDLRPLPWSAYDIPAQAIHCYLYGITSTGGLWTDECIERFKEFQNYCIETVVKMKRDDLYAVQLIAKLSADLEEDFSVDITHSLCVDGFAISKSESGEHMFESRIMDTAFSEVAFEKNSPPLDVSVYYDFNTLSSDSGVSVTSAKSSQVPQKINPNFDQKNFEDHPCNVPVDKCSSDSCDKDISDFSSPLSQCDLISFTSVNALDLPQSTDLSKSANSSNCQTCNASNFCMHLTIPFPSLLFVEKNMMLVMLSHIENPHEFYVNMAMENIMTLDELREQMTSLYESQTVDIPKINVTDLAENMFCAAHYVADGYWYRVKILCTNRENMKKHQVLVQYVDYGNTAVINHSNLKPLASQFSHHPSFAVKCALAGVIPNEENGTNNFPSYHWSKEAVKAFKGLTSFERCLTAQICTELWNGNLNEVLPVFLWDTEESDDLLINVALADCGMARFDNNLLSLLSVKQKTINLYNKDVNVLDYWDPMSEEYNDIKNSYAVDTDKIEVLTNGYDARDDEYTCKYFSLRGFCPRGNNCQYEHVPLLESGITREQEEVYCLDSVPLISESMNILVQVSAVISPTHFYVVLPFGCKDVDQIDSLVYSGKSYEDIVNTEAKDLFYAINDYYSNTPFQENTAIALSCGTIVAAQRKWDERWHRGRIVDVPDVNEPAKVFFVDAGDNEWVPRKLIRTILPQFLHTPFQAIQCSLNCVEPVGFKENKTWSSEAVSTFKDCVAGEILLARFVHRFGSVFHISLKKTRENDNQNIASILMAQGYAQYHNVIQTKKKETVYVPG